MGIFDSWSISQPQYIIWILDWFKSFGLSRSWLCRLEDCCWFKGSTYFAGMCFIFHLIILSCFGFQNTHMVTYNTHSLILLSKNRILSSPTIQKLAHWGVIAIFLNQNRTWALVRQATTNTMDIWWCLLYLKMPDATEFLPTNPAWEVNYDMQDNNATQKQNACTLHRHS